MARPSFQPTTEQRALVLKLASIGCTTDEILLCVDWGLPDQKPIDAKTLRLHFKSELAKGHAIDATRVRQRLHDLIDQGNVAAVIFYSKVRLGMREVSRVETTGADGVPLQTGPVLYLPQKNEPLIDYGTDRRDADNSPHQPAAPWPEPWREPLPMLAPPAPTPAPARALGAIADGSRTFPPAADARRR